MIDERRAAVPFLAVGSVLWAGWIAALAGQGNGLTPLLLAAQVVVGITAIKEMSRLWVQKQMPRFADANRAAFAAIAHESQPCPRCEAATRDTSGWCGACYAALRAHPVDSRRPTLVGLEAFNRRDLRTANKTSSRSEVTHVWGEPDRTARKSRSVSMMLRWAYPDAACEVEFAACEPSDPEVLWLRTTLTGTPVRAGQPLHERTVIRSREHRNQTAEIWGFAPLVDGVAGPLQDAALPDAAEAPQGGIARSVDRPLNDSNCDVVTSVEMSP